MSDPTPEQTAAELARRSRANQLAEDIGDLVNDVVSRLEEMSGELDMRPEDILDLVRDHTKEFPSVIAWHAWAEMFPAAALKKGMPMERVIGRLFEESPKLEDGRGKPVPRQAPALPQALVVLKSGMQIQGAMSVTPEGTLRMMTQSKDAETMRPCMVEQFFDYSDVSMIAVPRAMPAIATSKIITG